MQKVADGRIKGLEVLARLKNWHMKAQAKGLKVEVREWDVTLYYSEGRALFCGKV